MLQYVNFVVGAMLMPDSIHTDMSERQLKTQYACNSKKLLEKKNHVQLSQDVDKQKPKEAMQGYIEVWQSIFLQHIFYFLRIKITQHLAGRCVSDRKKITQLLNGV